MPKNIGAWKVGGRLKGLERNAPSEGGENVSHESFAAEAFVCIEKLKVRAFLVNFRGDRQNAPDKSDSDSIRERGD